MILAKGKIDEINIESFIESKLLSGQIQSVLIIVPTNRKLREFKKRIINFYTSITVSKINIETLTTLSTKLLNEKKAFIPLSEAASTVLIKETVNELELEYFASYSNGIPFGTLDKIKNVISEYKKHGISPTTLLDEAANLLGGEKKKAIDIANIYKLYLDKCNDLGAFELGDIYSEINRLSYEDLKTCFIRNFYDVDSLFLDGFDEFTNPELSILNSISELISENTIINFDYYENNEQLFAHLKSTYLSLIEIGFKIIQDTSPYVSSGFRNLIRKRLFTSSNTHPISDYKNVLNKNIVSSRIEEVDLIARTIKLILKDTKTEPFKICVSFNNISNYSSIIRDTFDRYGIPINLTDRIALKSSQPVIAVISVLELLENDFHFRDIINVLTNGFLEFRGIDTNNIISVANDLKITKGIQNWEVSINDALSLLKYQSEKSEKEKSILEKRYKKAVLDITDINNLLKPLKKRNSKEEFLNVFKDLLLHLKLPWSVLEQAEMKEEEFIKSITVLLQSISEVLLLLDSKDNNKKYNLNFYLDQLRTISNWARFNVKEKSDRGVLITSINEIRGLQFDYLFLGGMCDGDLPTKYSPEIFFSGSFQKKEQLHQSEERYHLYQALCCWNKGLYLTVPQNDSRAELIESTFVKDLEKVFNFNEEKFCDDNVILSKERLLLAYSKNPEDPALISAMHKNGFDIQKISNNIKNNDLRKTDPFGNNIYSGSISNLNNEIEDFLNEYSEKQFSVSQLETFAKCPFKYFTNYILKLEQLEEPSEEAEPIELGNVLHKILFDFYSKVTSENIPFGKVGSSEFTKLKNILFELADDRIAKLNLNSPIAFFEKEKILGIDGKRENSILFKFLLWETENLSNFKPTYFEFVFGSFPNSSEVKNSPKFSIGDLKLRGKIDRIDIDESHQLFNILDYKLKGKKPTFQELCDGLSLQLPVYMMASEYILNNELSSNHSANEMIIYSLDYSEKNFGQIPLKLTNKRKVDLELRFNLNREQFKITEEKLLEYHNKIKKGMFSLSSLENREAKVCRYCDFKSFCRVQEVFEA